MLWRVSLLNPCLYVKLIYSRSCCFMTVLGKICRFGFYALFLNDSVVRVTLGEIKSCWCYQQFLNQDFIAWKSYYKRTLLCCHVQSPCSWQSCILFYFILLSGFPNRSTFWTAGESMGRQVSKWNASWPPLAIFKAMFLQHSFHRQIRIDLGNSWLWTDAYFCHMRPEIWFSGEVKTRYLIWFGVWENLVNSNS